MPTCFCGVGLVHDHKPQLGPVARFVDPIATLIGRLHSFRYPNHNSTYFGARSKVYNTAYFGLFGPWGKFAAPPPQAVPPTRTKSPGAAESTRRMDTPVPWACNHVYMAISRNRGPFCGYPCINSPTLVFGPVLRPLIFGNSDMGSRRNFGGLPPEEDFWRAWTWEAPQCCFLSGRALGA